MAKKKLRSRVSEPDHRDTHQNTAGQNRGKTRNDVPSTDANKAASGKQPTTTKRKRTTKEG